MTDNDYTQLWQQVKDYIKLQVDYSKLTVAEKLTILLSRIILIVVALLLGASILLLLSAALVVALTGIVGETWVACLIVAAIYLLLLLIVFALKSHLITNPMARFISKLLINPTIDNNNNQTPEA